jgi:diguanylate cyclase (GGDEF)-like protein/PAS domain S-box-containing protein/putative nucleotidyltransferase with HDIG domain
MLEQIYRSVLEQSPVGCAFFKILCDDAGLPADFEILYVNPAFEALTGLSASVAVGKKITEILPDIRHGTVDWVLYYGELALNGGSKEFEQFFGDRNKWCKINAFSPLKGYFVTYLTDITAEMRMMEEQIVVNTFFNDIVIEYDEEFRYISYRSNQQFAREQKEKVIGRTVREVYGAEFGAQVEAVCLRARASGRIESWVHKSPLPGVDRWFQGSIIYRTDSFNQKKYIVVTSDITEKVEAERALFAEKERLRVTLHSIGDAVISTDKQGRIVSFNPVAEQLTGWKEQEVLGKNYREVFRIINEITKTECEDPVEKVLRTGHIVGLANHTALIARDGTETPIADSAAPIRDETGVVYGVVLVFRDVTDEKSKLSEIEYLSYHDSLTGLYNRRFFEEESRRLDVERNLPITLIIGDVNGLKLINDVFGHQAGDSMLQKTAGAIRKACRADDLVARWGGDEFVIILPKTSGGGAQELIDRIRKICSETEIESLKLSISFGFRTKDTPEVRLADVLRDAETEMYKNKLLESKDIIFNITKKTLATLFARIPRETEHSRRVAEIAKNIAKAMGMTEVQVGEIEKCGYLHDIGKIAISKDILEKPAALTEMEWSEIRRHPETGYRILAASQDTAGTAAHVLSHHERYDGTGYPAGLREEEIPLPARILAVADAYDAMTCDRPFRKAFPDAYAVDSLLRNSGTQFDPLIVKTFVERILNRPAGRTLPKGPVHGH